MKATENYSYSFEILRDDKRNNTSTNPVSFTFLGDFVRSQSWMCKLYIIFNSCYLNTVNWEIFVHENIRVFVHVN